ncbi:glycolate oxidase subunit GlcE [Imbroritus primus]|uniref:Glycolate oxidase subunit GlcE n=1 Tax=Imbroritus primus TaxID=3058603 RepID=A0ACD3SJX5_9BURK|nr:glycolate oxidase subunit GlcE [Burkholderiaceae bacterium PBA]
MTAILDTFRDRIRAATASGTPLRLRGSGTKDFYGQDPVGEILDTRAHAGIVAYDPAELVITARCGTPLADVATALAEQRQMLPFEPPAFGPAATFGGTVAAGLSGPRRQAVGALRDFVLGAVVMDGRGDIMHFGGQVMKNVAGYDVSRLLAGSLGTLGLVLEVSMKVLPLPVAHQTLRFELDEAQALLQVNRWGGQPLPITATAWTDNVLHVRLAGAAAAVSAAIGRLGGTPIDETEAHVLWSSLREQSHPWFAPALQGQTLWRIAVPSTAPVLSLPGTQLIEWGGGQRWWLTDAPAATVRAAAQAAGGHATLFRNGNKADGVFTPLSAPIAAIHTRLKDAFDPARIFNRGRMYPEF